MFAKALVLQYEDVTVAICVVDICAMRRELLDEVKKQVHAVTGIHPHNVLLSSTHTHASGSVESLLLGAADLPYRQKLPASIVQSIAQAQQKLCNATVAFGSVDEPEFVLCRRYKMKDGYEARNPVTGESDLVKTNPFGGEDQILEPVSQPDPQMCYVAFKNEEGEWLSLLANYSLHYVGDWQNGTISPDYFGAFSKHLKNKLNANDSFVAMMSNGTSGEINIWDFLNPERFPTENFKKSNFIGEVLAKKVCESVNNLEWKKNAPLSVNYKEVTVETRKPDTVSLDKFREIVSATSFEDLRGIDYSTMQKLYAREQVLLNEYPDTIKFPVQAIKIGNIVIGALGGEFFAETGLALKSESGQYQYFTVTLANDYVGYVCPEHEIQKGGYETWRCRTSYLHLKAEQQIREELCDLIHMH
jgi:neutral ceramidase